jgi:outer membrane protein
MRLPSATSKSVFRSALLGLALSCFAPSVLAEMRIAVVDSQRAVVETEDGLRMQATLKKIFDERQRELDQKQNELQKERAELEKQRTTMKPEVLQARAEKWQVEAQTVQQMFMEYNRELQRKQNELMQPILAQAMTVVQRLAKAEGFSMVIDKQAVPYVQADFDLTDKVIKAYNEGSGVAPAAAPTAKPAPAKVPPAAPLAPPK